MKKYGDTPRFDGPSLCQTCRNAQIMRGRSLSEEVTLCRAGDSPFANLRIERPIIQCSEYDDKRVPSLYHMEKIAWRFSADKRKKTMGFFSATDWKEKLKSEGKEDDDLPPIF